MYKRCRATDVEFEITAKDLAFYQDMGVPCPTLCPEERLRRRLSFRNESSLYRRSCDATGKTIISMYSPDKPYTVFDNDFWWSDNWNAYKYGREYDFSRPFFEQLNELLHEVPKMARIQQGENENSTYCNCVAYNRNCYLIFSATGNEGCLHSQVIIKSRDCLDCFSIYSCELCYECVACLNCYNSCYLDNCKNCSDSWFLKNCISCSNCFGCSNLRNKEYYFLNEKLSKEQYFKQIKALKLNSRTSLNSFRKQFEEYSLAFFQPNYQGVQNESVSGDYISNCKNAHSCYDVEEVEDCKYCDTVTKMKSAYDVSYYGATGSNELLYECEAVGHGVFNVMFSKLIWGGSSNITYSYECFASGNLFGCAGLKHANYCILNRQYSQEEYTTLTEKIVEQMKDTGEWGEFFPSSLSPFGYNESTAHEYFPLTETEAQEGSLNWHQDINRQNGTVQETEIPDLMPDTDNAVLNKLWYCQGSKTSYRIEPKELSLYRKLELPLPALAPKARHLKRIKRKNPRRLFAKKCLHCEKDLTTTYSPKSSERVLCKSCYLEILE